MPATFTAIITAASTAAPSSTRAANGMSKGGRRFAVTAALAASLLSPVVHGDIAEVAVENGDIMTFEYEGDKLRINLPRKEQGYMLMRDNRMYVVSEDNGELMVFDLGSALRMFGDMAANATPDTAQSEVLSLEATGQREQLGGIDGEVYRLRFIGPKGREQEADMVLSKDPLAVAFRDAVQHMVATMAGSLDREAFKDELEAGEDMQQKLQALNMGVLRYGEDMQIRSLSDTTVAAERFELPAPPTDLGDMIKNALGGNSGEPPASPGEEEEAKSAADTIGDAFGRLFGK